ncbi:MAG: DUF4097 family beta strand repeat-containing protein [Arenimonas sp.]
MYIRSCGAVALLLAAAPAFAATPINETRALAVDGQVHIENIKGRIVVRTWANPQVRVTGTLGKGVEKLEITGDARSLDVRVKYPNSRGGWNLWGRDDNRTEPSNLEITLPQRASVDIESVSADVDVQQMAGRKLEVSSVSGNVVVTASSPGEASFENVSGDTTLRITTAKLRVQSVSGDLRLQGGLTGDVDIESVSGDVELGAKALNRLEVSTVSGDAILRAALRPAGAIKAETLSGELRLELPRGSSAKLHVETFSGDIESPDGRVDREEHGPGKSLDTTLGDGSGRINLESFSGDVRLNLN